MFTYSSFGMDENIVSLACKTRRIIESAEELEGLEDPVEPVKKRRRATTQSINSRVWLQLLAKEELHYTKAGRPNVRNWARTSGSMAMTLKTLAEKQVGPIHDLLLKFGDSHDETKFLEMCQDLESCFIQLADELLNISPGQKITSKSMETILDILKCSLKEGAFGTGLLIKDNGADVFQPPHLNQTTSQPPTTQKWYSKHPLRPTRSILESATHRKWKVSLTASKLTSVSSLDYKTPIPDYGEQPVKPDVITRQYLERNPAYKYDIFSTCLKDGSAAKTWAMNYVNTNPHPAEVVAPRIYNHPLPYFSAAQIAFHARAIPGTFGALVASVAMLHPPANESCSFRTIIFNWTTHCDRFSCKDMFLVQ
jgi:hypothetical protein